MEIIPLIELLRQTRFLLPFKNTKIKNKGNETKRKKTPVVEIYFTKSGCMGESLGENKWKMFN